MSATDELRRLLDERGVEWQSPSGLASSFADSITFIGNVAVVSEIDGSDLLRINFDGTPEQAIAAMLGRGTCEVEGFDDGMDEGMDGHWFAYAPPTWFLSCGHEVYGSERPRYCPVCGRKVVE